LLEGLGTPGPTWWHRLDPLTKLLVSVGTVVALVLLGGIIASSLLTVVAVLLPAALARCLARLVRISILLALPLLISAVLVNVLVSQGVAMAEVGPLTITEEGIRRAGEVAVRVVGMAGAVTLFYLTTRPSELVASLQRHGAPPRLAFVVHNAIAMMPRLAERAGEVAEAQRARGLDTEGNVVRRSRGLLAVAAPTVLAALAEAEARTLALETRAFSRPGRRTLLWWPRDSGAQRAARWSIVIALALLALARLASVTLP
jgi:energy-coupling factor transport system permease protein